jgi:hypothetical protein
MTRNVRKINLKKEKFVLVYGFSPKSLYPVAFGLVVRQSIRAKYMAEETVHLMIARKQRETGSTQYSFKKHMSNDLTSSH